MNMQIIPAQRAGQVPRRTKAPLVLVLTGATSERRLAMQRRTLGANGPGVVAIGLGCMGMSDLYGPADAAESIATIHAAIDAGVTLLDTGDFYGMGHNEMLIGEALQGRRRDGFVLSVKFGALRGPPAASSATTRARRR